jgi:hypothetical protein
MLLRLQVCVSRGSDWSLFVQRLFITIESI